MSIGKHRRGRPGKAGVDFTKGILGGGHRDAVKVKGEKHCGSCRPFPPTGREERGREDHLHMFSDLLARDEPTGADTASNRDANRF